ncbi:MAG: DUF955 domain-containing protein, partial [Halobacteriales archaeon]
RLSFSDPGRRQEGMRGTIETWLDELIERVGEARSSEAFREWLDVQSRFHDYSYRNTLLIKLQCPGATRVAGYRTWQDEFDRQVEDGAEAIWIWAPIVTQRCPDCEQSRRDHEGADCDYDETPPEEWPEGVVGFKPVPVFDVSQTEGEPLPELETAAAGDGDALLEQLLDHAGATMAEVRVVPADDWSHGDAEGVCSWPDGPEGDPVIELRDRADTAAAAGTLLHELAHARLHAGVSDPGERSKREVEAEAVAYIVGRYFGLDTANSAFYLAAWADDERDAIADRMDRISSTAEALIETIDG